MRTQFGHVTAWRAWQVWRSLEGMSLQSVTGRRAEGEWRPGEPMEARCGYWNMQPRGCLCATCPDIAGGCGIYAYRDIPHDATFSNVVVGNVALWGVVIEHEQGYRAQYAYPVDLTYVICEWCDPSPYSRISLRWRGVTPHEPPHSGLVALSESVALVATEGENRVYWSCRAHAGNAVRRAQVLESKREGMPREELPGLAVAQAITDRYDIRLIA